MEYLSDGKISKIDIFTKARIGILFRITYPELKMSNLEENDFKILILIKRIAAPILGSEKEVIDLPVTSRQQLYNKLVEAKKGSDIQAKMAFNEFVDTYKRLRECRIISVTKKRQRYQLNLALAKYILPGNLSKKQLEETPFDDIKNLTPDMVNTILKRRDEVYEMLLLILAKDPKGIDWLVREYAELEMATSGLLNKYLNSIFYR